MKVTILAAAILIAACAPRLVGGNSAGGMIHRSGSVGTDRAIALSEQHCAKHGKVARITNTNQLTNTWRFECVAE